MFVYYESIMGVETFITIWPLVLTLPAYLRPVPGSLEGLLYMGLPSAMAIGTIAWFVSRRFVRPKNTDSR